MKCNADRRGGTRKEEALISDPMTMRLTSILVQSVSGSILKSKIPW